MDDTELANMSKARRLIDAIGSNLGQGFACCRIASKYRQAFEAQRLDSRVVLHRVVYKACADEAVLALARTVDKSRGSSSLQNLLGLSEQCPTMYNNQEAAEIQRTARCHLAEIERNHLVSQVRNIRDKMLAHTDLNALDVQSAPSLVSIADVEAMLQRVHAIVNVYIDYIHIPDENEVCGYQIVPASSFRVALRGIEPEIDSYVEYLSQRQPKWL